MRYQVKKLGTDSITEFKYGENSLIADDALEQELEYFDTLYGLFHEGTLLWFVLPHQDHWVGTNPITTPVFDYYLKNICTLENKEPQNINEVDDDGEMLSYYLSGGCGGPGDYFLNDDSACAHVYISEGTAWRVTEDFGMEFIGKEQFLDLYEPRAEESKPVYNGISLFSELGFSAPIGSYYGGFKEWGNKGLMVPLEGFFEIMIQGFEHGFLRLAIKKSEVELI